MKFFHAATFAVALMLAGVPAMSAQEPDQNKEKPKPQDEEKKKQPPAKEKEKPQPKADERPQAEPRTDKEKPRSDMDKGKPQKQDEKANRQEKERQTPETNRSQNPQRGTRTNARRIPPEKFHASFGREHHFHVERRGDRQFQYGGYVFEFVDVLPAGWSFDDECYIEEDGDDYYLVDVIHPEIRVLVVIVG
ncbi:MAG TPA: hypothetical protein VIW23_13370 [Candidatus Acidoferrum sp.]|jgi:outer membrane biosynthesis protein TonB